MYFFICCFYYFLLPNKKKYKVQVKNKKQQIHQGQVTRQRRFVDQGRFGQVEEVHVRQQVSEIAANRHPQHEEGR